MWNKERLRIPICAKVCLTSIAHVYRERVCDVSFRMQTINILQCRANICDFGKGVSAKEGESRNGYENWNLDEWATLIDTGEEKEDAASLCKLLYIQYF